VVVAVTVNGVEDFISSFVKTVTERMVVTVFVVISHITLKLLRSVDRSPSSLLYSNLFSSGVARVDDVNLAPLRRVGAVVVAEGLLGVAGGLLAVGLGAEVGSNTSYNGTGTFAVLTLRDVNLARSVVGGRAVDCVKVPVVGPVFYFNM
jgi:hypothetical protein